MTEFETPETIGPYKVVRPIARGGMAAVFEGIDESGRTAAVKLLTHRGLARPRFSREYRALTLLDHPNIVRVFEFGVHEGDPYLSMELLEGDPIHIYAKSVGPPGSAERTRQMLRTVADVADALQYLHDRGIVHRDLKSSNIQVLPSGRVKLLDFGTARFLSGKEDITRHGEFVGTFAYASPEQITGGGVDGRSDLYSLGVLLYRLSTGQRPFDAESPHELARLHVERKPVPPMRVVSSLPTTLNKLILRLLEKDPEDRPQRASVVAEYLRSIGGDKAKLPPLGVGRLVGREPEVAEIKSYFAAIDPGSMVLIVGPPGSGRGRAAKVIVAHGQNSGWSTVIGKFGGERGLGVLAAVIEELTGDLSLPVGPRPKSGLSRVEGVFLELFDQLAAMCISAEEPTLICLEDLDLASPVALDAISFIRQRARENRIPVLFLATAPDDSDLPGTSIRKRLPDAHRVELGPLTEDQVQVLMNSMLGGRLPSQGLTNRIWRLTGGMPGFVGELVRAMVQSSMLVPREQAGVVTWVESENSNLSIPTTARDAISIRLDSLPNGSVRIVQALAVAGGALGAEELAYGVDAKVSDVRDALHRLVSSRVLDTVGESSNERWDFRISLARDIVNERLRPLRREVFRQRLSDVLKEASPSPYKVRLLASSRRADQALVEAVTWAAPLLEWSRYSEVLPVLEEVVKVTSMVRNLDRLVLSRFYLLLGRARQEARSGNPQADQAMQRAYALSPDEIIRGEVELYQAKGLVVKGELKKALKWLDKAANKLAGGSPELRSQVQIELGVVQWYLGAFDQAEEFFAEGLNIARSANLTRLVARALGGRGVLRLCIGQLDASESDLREAGVLYEQAGDRSGLWHIHGNLADILRRKGLLTETVALLLSEWEAVKEGGSWMRQALYVINLAEVEVDLFRLGRARERLEKLEADINLHDHLHLRAAAGMIRAKIAIVSSEPTLAVEILEPLVERCFSVGIHVISAQMLAYLGEARVLCGDEELGERNLADSIRSLQRQRQLPTLGDACAARSRALWQREDPEITFGPVLRWINREPANLLNLEYLIMSARYAGLRADINRSGRLWREASDLQGQIMSRLSPTDAEALAVHPWTVEISKGIRL